VVCQPNVRWRLGGAARTIRGMTVHQPVEDSRVALTGREQQVLECTARGLTNAEIARELHVTTHAVKFHLLGIYRKLGVANRTQAVARYLSDR
jgi:ATP/maltotriose-dependent transcriptional regulator MalT